MSRRLYWPILSAILVMILMAVVAAQDTGRATLAQNDATPTPNINWVSASTGINVRSGPGLQYSPIGALAVGTWVQPLMRSVDGEWILITYLTTQGWVQRDGVSWRLNTDALPIIARDLPTPIPRPLYYNTPGGPTYTPNANWVAVGADGAFVRSGPGQGYVPIGQLFTGDVVDPVAHDEREDWVLIRYENGFGWIRYDLVVWVSDVLALPVIDFPELTPSFTPVPTRAPSTWTPTPTQTPTETPTSTPSNTSSPSATPTSTHTPSPSPTTTPTATLTDTVMPSYTPSPVPPTATHTLTVTWTPSPEPPTASATPTVTLTLTPEPPTDTPSATPTHTITVTSSPEPTAVPVTIVVVLPADTASPTSPPIPTTIPLPSAVPSATPTASESPSPAPPTATHTSEPTRTLTPTWTATEPPTLTPSAPPPTEPPTGSPTQTPTATTTPEAVAALPPDSGDDFTDPTAGDPADGPFLEASPGATDADSDATSSLALTAGGILAIAAAVYIGLYATQSARAARTQDAFPLAVCPVCEEGRLALDQRRYRVLGIPRVRRVIRCDTCRSVLRQVGNKRWRYAVDGAVNADLFDQINGRVVTETQLMEISPEYRGTHPEYIEGDELPRT